jgi:hypothetical protein
MIGAGSDGDADGFACDENGDCVGDTIVFDQPACESDGEPNLPSEGEGIFVVGVEGVIDERTAEIGFWDTVGATTTDEEGATGFGAAGAIGLGDAGTWAGLGPPPRIC